MAVAARLLNSIEKNTMCIVRDTHCSHRTAQHGTRAFTLRRHIRVLPRHKAVQARAGMTIRRLTQYHYLG